MGKVVAAGVLRWHRVLFLRVFDVLIKTLIFAGGGRALLLRFFTWALTPSSLCAEAWLCSVPSAASHLVCTLPG